MRSPLPLLATILFAAAIPMASAVTLPGTSTSGMRPTRTTNSTAASRRAQRSQQSVTNTAIKQTTPSKLTLPQQPLAHYCLSLRQALQQAQLVQPTAEQEAAFNLSVDFVTKADALCGQIAPEQPAVWIESQASFSSSSTSVEFSTGSFSSSSSTVEFPSSSASFSSSSSAVEFASTSASFSSIRRPLVPLRPTR
jgi:hypothetical protein